MSRSSALPIYLGLLFAVLTIVALVLLVLLRHALLIVFVSVLFAAALSGPSEWLHGHLRLPRALAAVLIYLVAFVVLVGVGWLVVPPLLGQVAEFADRAPEYAERYEGVRDAYEGVRDDYPALPHSTPSSRGSATRSSTARAIAPPPCRATSSRSSSTCSASSSSRCSS